MKSWSDVYLPPIDGKYFFPQLALCNSVTSQNQLLPIKEQYRIYVCGITPYDATHLGHAATYLVFDLVNRYLRAMGKIVHYVQNVTDIDDPLLERANRDGIDWEDLAQSQVDLFRGDMSDLHVIPPESYIGAVEAIPLVLAAIEDLSAREAIYKVDEDLYFSVHADPEFGSRSQLARDEMIEIFSSRGGDPGREGKRDPLDALVWLRQRPHEPGWPSPFGQGRPGWHIECCAIALTYLPTPVADSADPFVIDIQGGGSDLLFPHHEMGASQAALITGKEFARLYMHTGMIGLNGEKMSKSLGNLVFLSELVKSGVDPMAIRIALLSDHYAKDRMWNDSLLTQGIEFLDRLRLLLSRPEVAPTSEVIQNLIFALSNNLDTVGAFEILRSWCVETENGEIGGHAGELSRAIDLLLGIAI
ncbi:MAG: cysteine--1-D-myo-inosityl 2-amino-2-deoxy-alpha-D-glucopyranoside ligase [Actinobacteria bacterium]|nr:cysteine--1-D-myo-inosityl 2-amino-2-deoxy-alpha-D-glucopyranoside ligase [Actinomycetota bacterium]